MIWAKRILSLVLLGVLIYFFLPLLKDLKFISGLLRSAIWAWLPFAIIIQLISYAFLTWLNALSLKPFSGHIGFIKLALLLTSMAFIEIAVPSAGASGVAMRIRLLGKFGYSPEASIYSLFVETFSEIVALISVALVGLVYLLKSGRFSPVDTFWLISPGLAIIGLVFAAWRLLMNPVRSRKILLFLACKWNRFLGRFRSVDIPKLEERFNLFRQELGRYKQVHFWKFCLAAYGKVLFDVATLGAGFYLFRFDISPGTLLTGYGLILLFSGIAVLPGGLGMADAYVPVLFSWLNVPGAVGLAAGLTYRLIAFWLVRFAGFLSWQYLESS